MFYIYLYIYIYSQILHKYLKKSDKITNKKHISDYLFNFELVELTNSVENLDCSNQQWILKSDLVILSRSWRVGQKRTN